jgi:hypothetical protein
MAERLIASTERTLLVEDFGGTTAQEDAYAEAMRRLPGVTLGPARPGFWMKFDSRDGWVPSPHGHMDQSARRFWRFDVIGEPA